jgi:pimeloyl-ACP methyl ester carboxylesterase
MKRKKIVLIHGWGASSVKLEPLAKKLTEHGWDVLLPKLPGFDLPAPKHPLTLGGYSKYVTGLSKKKWREESFFVFGHSFGGRVASKMSRNDNVLGIVLCSSGGLSRGNPVKRSVFMLLSKIGKVFLVNQKMAIFWKKILYKAAGEHDYEKTRGAMRETFKNIIKEDIKKLLPKIKQPVLILWSSNDRVTPIKDAVIAGRLIKNPNVVVYKEGGHQLPYRKPGEVAKEITKWYTQLD